MLQYVSVTIDGAPVRAEKGTSVLDTAIHVGVCIPHLCHIPGIHDMGACRLCIVEEVKNGRSKVTASCTLLVEEGMVIRSNTDKILKMRKNIAELLVAQAPNSKAIQDIAVRCGVKDVRYPFRNENCVLCGRCVDYCKNCNACILFCPMSVTPCGGPMKKGQERLCGQCDSQLNADAQKMPGVCVWCELGKGFQCSRYLAV